MHKIKKFNFSHASIFLYESVQVSKALVKAQNASVYGQSISQSAGFQGAESTLGKMWIYELLKQILLSLWQQSANPTLDSSVNNEQ